MSDETKQAKEPEKAEAAAPAKPDGKAEAKHEATADAKDAGKADAKGGAKPARAAVPSPMLAMIGIIVGALAIGGAAGAMLIAPRIVAARAAAPAAKSPAAPAGETGQAAPAKKGDKHGAAAKASIYRIDNLIVNPADTQGTRFLMASVAFELPDDKAEAAMRDHEAQVRDIVIATLERKTLEQLTRPGAREQIKKEILAALAPVTGEMEWVRIYLPQFVLQ